MKSSPTAAWNTALEFSAVNAGGDVDFAGLEKRVVLVGQGNKFEIWSEQAWQAWRDSALADGDDGGDPVPDLDSLAF